jgi:hypothetical protein
LELGAFPIDGSASVTGGHTFTIETHRSQAGNHRETQQGFVVAIELQVVPGTFMKSAPRSNMLVGRRVLRLAWL